MNPFLKWSLVGGPAVILLVLAGCSFTRAGYKSPAYSLRDRFQGVEIREYPALALVQTLTKKEAEGRDGSFMRLFRFIAKGNAAAQKIPMTTPVLYRGEGSSEAMAFVLPSTMKTAEAPAPLDAAVSLEMRPSGNYAVLRMRGRNAKAREKAASTVRSALNGSEWGLEGGPEFAFYDPPWIPGFLEKNEIHWRVVKSQQKH